MKIVQDIQNRVAGQRALVEATKAELALAEKNRWPMAAKELKVRLARQVKALEASEAVLAEVSRK